MRLFCRFWMLVAALYAPYCGAAQPVTFAVNEWCPYICNGEGPRRGILLDIVDEIFTARGETVSFISMPLPRGVEAVRSGKVQGIVGVIPAVAPELVFPQEAAIDTQFCFFTPAGARWTFDGFGQRYPQLALGMAYGKVLDPRLEHDFSKLSKVSGNGAIRRMIAMLKLRRIDALIEEKRGVQYIIKKEHLPELRIAGCLERKFEYVAFAPASADAARFAELFSAGMVRLRESGRLADIIAAYIGDK